MLTPLAQFPTITSKTATDSVSKNCFSFLVENESREHGQAMFVLFSYGAVKHGDGRNHFSEKKTKQNPKKRRLLFWKASESPLVPTKGSECGDARLGVDNG